MFSDCGLQTVSQKPMAGKDEKQVLCLGLNFAIQRSASPLENI